MQTHMKLYSLNFQVNFKNNFRPFAAPSKCRPVRPAPPSHPLATPVPLLVPSCTVLKDGFGKLARQACVEPLPSALTMMLAAFASKYPSIAGSWHLQLLIHILCLLSAANQRLLLLINWTD